MAELLLIWSDRSLLEYRKLTAYLLDEWGKEKTLLILKDLRFTTLKIRSNPEHFPLAFKRKAIRKCVFSPQTSIYFKIINNTIEIVSLFDNRQNPRKLKGI